MYITCQECKTTFSLDENLLKPTGSKVRCSQCGNIFTAVPPPIETPEADVPTDVETPAPDSLPEAPFDAPSDTDAPGLNGIDIAELDSFLKEEQAEGRHRLRLKRKTSVQLRSRPTILTISILTLILTLHWNPNHK